MNLNEIEAQGFILALFIRDDGERFLLGTGAYQFLDSQLHFTANSFANDVVEVQGNDGVFFAGQVRRANTQAFDGYIGDADVPREEIENYRRQFIAFFRKNYYYTVVYVFNNGSAIKRQKGFIVDAPEVKELYQIYPQYHIALNFEDVNYYQYNENDEGIEQFGKSAIITLAGDSNTGGLIWQQGSVEPIIYGNTEQQVPAPTPDSPQPIINVTGNLVLGNGKNLWPTQAYKTDYYISSTGVETYSAGTSIYGNITVKPNTEYTISLDTSQYATLRVHAYDSNGNWIEQIIDQSITSANKSATFTTPNNITYLRWSYYTNITDGQLELGSTVTTYEPFENYIIELGSIELCKIGSYQDYIYRDENEDWYIHKEIDKTTLGSLVWYSSITAQSGKYRMQSPSLNSLYAPPTTSTEIASILCTHYVALSQGGTWNCITGFGFNTAGTENSFVYDPSYNSSSSSSSFKTWATNNNVTLYYALKTSTETKITDNTLITQLNDWASSLIDTGGVEWDNIGAVWEIGGSGGPVNVTIDSIDNVYPIWEVTGPATNPEIEIIESNTSIKYTGSIGADEKLVVDMLNKTALVNGVSMIGNISGVWCYLKPGNNKVTYVTDNAGAMPSKLLWQEVVG